MTKPGRGSTTRSGRDAVITTQTLLLLAILSTNAAAHGGGLDQYGGHTDYATGIYHCHRAPCHSQVRQDQSALVIGGIIALGIIGLLWRFTAGSKGTPGNGSGSNGRSVDPKMLVRRLAAEMGIDEPTLARLRAQAGGEEGVLLGLLETRYRAARDQEQARRQEARRGAATPAAAATEEATLLRHGNGESRPCREVAAQPVMPASEPGLELDERLGSGAFGVTWSAYDHVDEDEVAVKIFRPTDWTDEGPDGRITLRSSEYAEQYRFWLKRFLEEAEHLEGISHPAVVEVRRHAHGFGSAYMVMEYIAGGTLKDAIRRTRGARNIQTVRNLMIRLCSALSAVHQAGMVHRDIKPANIMLRTPEDPVLIDFGAARPQARNQAEGMTQILTPGYAPIEQHGRNDHQGPWTDLYAVAAIGHEMLLGRPPKDAPTRVIDPKLEQLDALERQTGRSRTIDAIRRGLAVQAGARPQTCAEMQQILTAERPRTGYTPCYGSTV